MTDYAISGLTLYATPTVNDEILVLKVTDTTTPPAGPNGSDQRATIGSLLNTLKVPSLSILGTTFTSGTGTSFQTVTGMSLFLATGTYKLNGRFYYTGAGTVGSTQTFNFTFGGTTSAVQGAWQFRTAAYTAPVSTTTLTTSSGLSPTVTSTTYPLDWEAYAVVTGAGTLQAVVASTTSGDEVSVLAGSYLQYTKTA
jgi:hypothetical protein